jgi:hypothetical protein
MTSSTDLVTTSTTTDKLWTWGEGVVTDPEKPEGEWAELHEWMRFEIESRRYYFRRDREDFHRYQHDVNPDGFNRQKIGPGCYLRTMDGNGGISIIWLPRKIVNQIDTPLFAGKSNYGKWQCPVHVCLMRTYRSYDREKYQAIDHMNGDPSDNRPSNLRVVTQRQNRINTSINKWTAPGVKYVKERRCWVGTLVGKHNYFIEESDAISYRRLRLQEAITKGDLEPHDLWAFDKRVEAAYAYRRANNIDAHGRKLDHPAILAPIDPAANLVNPATPTRPIRAYGSTLWYRP